MLLGLPCPTVIPAAHAAPPVPLAQAALARTRLDPRLTAALAEGSPAVPVWVEFADKGETGPADLAARLAAAERELSPENRRRRERANVHPIVDWLDLPLEPAYVRALEARRLSVYGHSRWFNRVAVRTSGMALESLAALPFVRRVAPVEMAIKDQQLERPKREATGVGPPATPSRATRATALDYGFSLRQIMRLGLTAVHDSGYIGTGINVAVLDNGFNFHDKHEALRQVPFGDRLVDFVQMDHTVQDTSVAELLNFGHGTATLSVLAGRAPGRYMGAAPGCDVSLARTEQEASEKPIEMVWWGMGAEWADSLGCEILSASLNYRFFDPPGPDVTYAELDGHTTIVTRAAEIAAAKGILVVVSGGNSGSLKIFAPADANGDSVIAIAAVDTNEVRAVFSSVGPTADGRIKPDLAAQGVAVMAASDTGQPQWYDALNGTSFSAPLVAGLAACLMQARPSWPPVRIIRALKATATQASAPDTLLGWGIPNGLAALQYVPDTTGIPPGSPIALSFAGPNPLRAGATATVSLSLGSQSPVTGYRVRVLDAAGRLVRSLGAGTLAPGTRLSIPWHGDDAHGRTLVPGLYFLDLEGAGRHHTVRVVVLR